MNYEREFSILLRNIKIFNDEYYFISKNSIIKYHTLYSHDYKVVLTIEKYSIVDYHIDKDSIFLLTYNYNSNIYFMHFIEDSTHFITNIEMDNTEFYHTRSRINKFIFHGNNIIFNLDNDLIHSTFNLSKLRKNENYNKQARNLLKINYVVKYNQLNAFTDDLVLDSNELFDHNDFILKTKVHYVSIMISNYYVFAVNNKLYILRKQRKNWSDKPLILPLDNNFIINSLNSMDQILFVLAINYDMMKCRVYSLKMKNLYLK